MQDLKWVYQLIPSFISIFLILSSTWATGSLERRVNTSSADEEVKNFAKRVALDWGARLGFHSAMFSTLGGALVSATDPFRGWLLIVAVLVVVSVWYLTYQKLWGEHLGELHEGKWSLATKLDLIVIVLNLGIVLEFILNHPSRRATLGELLSRLWPG